MYTNLPTSQGYIFRILQHFATTICSFSNFDNFFPEISFVIPRLKIFLKRKSSITQVAMHAHCSFLIHTTCMHSVAVKQYPFLVNRVFISVLVRILFDVNVSTNIPHPLGP